MDIVIKVDVIITVIIVALAALPRFDLFFPGGPVSETCVDSCS